MGGLAAKNAKLIIHDLLFHNIWHIFSQWRVRSNELSRAKQGASKATSGNLTALDCCLVDITDRSLHV